MHASQRVVVHWFAVGWALVHMVNSVFGFFCLHLLHVQLSLCMHAVQRPLVEEGHPACSHSPHVNSVSVFRALHIPLQRLLSLQLKHTRVLMQFLCLCVSGNASLAFLRWHSKKLENSVLVSSARKTLTGITLQQRLRQDQAERQRQKQRHSTG